MILLKKSPILVRLAAVQPDDRIQVLELPLAPLIKCTVHNSVIIPGVDEQDLVLQLLWFSFVKKPQTTGQTLRIEEVVADTDHHVHMACPDQLLADIFVLALAVCCRGSHDKTSPAGLIQIGIEIGNP